VVEHLVILALSDWVLETERFAGMPARDSDSNCGTCPPRAEEDGIGVLRGLFGQGGDVQPAQRHKAPRRSPTLPLVVAEITG